MKSAVGEGDTDLGTLGFIERRATDGRADKHSTQGSAATVMASAVCNPGCTRLENTQVGSENIWTNGQHGLKTCRAQNQVLLGPRENHGLNVRVLVDPFPEGLIDYLPRTGKWCHWGR